MHFRVDIAKGGDMTVHYLKNISLVAHHLLVPLVAHILILFGFEYLNQREHWFYDIRLRTNLAPIRDERIVIITLESGHMNNIVLCVFAADQINKTLAYGFTGETESEDLPEILAGAAS